MIGAKTPHAWLAAHGAQADVLDGLARFADWRSLWSECPRGDWALGIAERLGVDHLTLVRAAIPCARVAEGSEEAVGLIAISERWTNGEVTAEEVAAASLRLEEASKRAVEPALDAANRSALAVGLGIADRSVLPSAPAAAAESVMVASIDCGFELAMRWAHDQCASAVRDVIPWSVIEACLTRLDDAG